MRPEPTVLMIVGWGRSGSTLLANSLGELPGVLAAGELRRVLAPGQVCGCGQAVRECPFWRPVLDAAAAEAGAGLDELHAVHERVLKPRRTLALLRAGDDADLRRVLAFTRALYAGAASAAEARVIVDGSKEPTSAALLLRLPELRAAFLHLVRDVRATSYSWQHRQRAGQQSLPVSTSALRWAEWNLLAELVLARAERRLRLRYEDFVAEPGEALRRVGSLAGLSADLAEGGAVTLGGNHHVGGNPNRYDRGQVQIRADDEWKRAIPVRDGLVATVLTAPLLLRYGYPLDWRQAITSTR